MKTNYNFTLTLAEDEIKTIQNLYDILSGKSLTISQIFEIIRTIANDLGEDDIESVSMPYITIEREERQS